MKNLTILTCNYNTPFLIKNLIKSIKKTQKILPDEILVVNTGHDDPYEDFNTDSLSLYLQGRSHGEASNIVLRWSISNRYALLVDSDVLFLKDISKPFQIFKDGGYALMGEVVGDRGGKKLHPRVNPWFCFMDLKQLKQHNIQFYDHHRTKEIKSDKIYDIGSTMYEDVINAGLTIAHAKMEGKYFKHYEGMSWRVQKYDPDNGDTDIDIGGTHDNIQLYELGLRVREQYEQDVKKLWEP